MRQFVLFILVFTTHLLFADINLPKGLTIEHFAAHNDEIKGILPINNKGDEKIRVKISLADYHFTYDGNNFFDPPGTHPRSNAPWVSLKDEFYVEIPPNETVNVDYRMHVPSDRSLQGSYWSVILVEPQKQLPKEVDEEGGLSINTVVRYGVQLITHIQGTGEECLEVLGNHMDQNENSRSFTIDVKNTGTILVRPKMTLELYNNKAEQIAQIDGGQFRIFPDSSIRYTAPLNDIPSGSYRSLILFDYGEDSLFGYESEISID